MIWLLVNRDPLVDEVVDLALDGIQGAEEPQWFDLYHGNQMDDVTSDDGGATARLSLHVEAGGYGAVLLTLTGTDPDFQVKCTRHACSPTKCAEALRSRISSTPWLSLQAPPLVNLAGSGIIYLRKCKP